MGEDVNRNEALEQVGALLAEAAVKGLVTAGKQLLSAQWKPVESVDLRKMNLRVLRIHLEGDIVLQFATNTVQ